jgi:hypothetical protein
VRVRREDVERLVAPLSSPQPPRDLARDDRASPWRFDSALSEEEIEQGWQALQELETLGERIAERRGGRPLSDSAEIIRTEREKRSRRLYEATRNG